MYENQVYIVLTHRANDKNVMNGFGMFSCALLAKSEFEHIKQFFEGTNRLLDGIFLTGYAQNETLRLERVLTKPENIRAMVEVFGKRYSVGCDLLQDVIDYANLPDDEIDTRAD